MRQAPNSWRPDPQQGHLNTRKGPALEHSPEVVKVCVKAYLGHIGGLRREILSLEQLIEETQGRLGIMGVTFDKQGRSSIAGDDAIPAGIARVEELRQQWLELAESDQAEVMAAAAICSRRHVGRWAMWQNIVMRRTWADVARELGYSESRAREIGGAGAREIYALMPEHWRRAPIPNSDAAFRNIDAPSNPTDACAQPDLSDAM